jgi:hypothetical protein
MTGIEPAFFGQASSGLETEGQLRIVIAERTAMVPSAGGGFDNMPPLRPIHSEYQKSIHDARAQRSLGEGILQRCSNPATPWRCYDG